MNSAASRRVTLATLRRLALVPQPLVGELGHVVQVDGVDRDDAAAIDCPESRQHHVP